MVRERYQRPEVKDLGTKWKLSYCDYSVRPAVEYVGLWKLSLSHFYLRLLGFTGLRNFTADISSFAGEQSFTPLAIPFVKNVCAPLQTSC